MVCAIIWHTKNIKGVFLQIFPKIHENGKLRVQKARNTRFYFTAV